MAKNPSDRHENATLLLREAEHAFGRRIRAAITPPVPVEIPEEAGIRRREEDVTTLETRVRNVVEPPSDVQSRASPEGQDAPQQDARSERDRASASGSGIAASGVHDPRSTHDAPALDDAPAPADADESLRADLSHVGLATDPHAIGPSTGITAGRSPRSAPTQAPDDPDQAPAAPYERRRRAPADPVVAARQRPAHAPACAGHA